jgi:hypothetical protein
VLLQSLILQITILVPSAFMRLMALFQNRQSKSLPSAWIAMRRGLLNPVANVQYLFHRHPFFSRLHYCLHLPRLFFHLTHKSSVRPDKS